MRDYSKEYFLKTGLKIGDWTEGVWEGGLEVSQGLNFRTRIQRRRRGGDFYEKRTDEGEVMFKAVP